MDSLHACKAVHRFILRSGQRCVILLCHKRAMRRFPDGASRIRTVRTKSCCAVSENSDGWVCVVISIGK
ncbi:hypothetical protein NDU88_007943 [Pleurodeles waltl]|uniref:Uncharacterized protein n=1 Tax=Pleurodeles waltl TaxID=8319 RepID=A0AAV7NBN3_PLEWA|nr:hypothetical protein NDU88_007943 [Pleurodeles waltl]